MADPPELVRLASEKAVQAIEVEYGGCPWSPCREYRLRIGITGDYEYEGKASMPLLGHERGRIGAYDAQMLFEWLEGHPTLYASSRREEVGNDAQFITYRFFLKKGETITLETDDATFNPRDPWVLAKLVDALVLAKVNTGATETSRP